MSRKTRAQAAAVAFPHAVAKYKANGVYVSSTDMLELADLIDRYIRRGSASMRKRKDSV